MIRGSLEDHSYIKILTNVDSIIDLYIDFPEDRTLYIEAGCEKYNCVKRK
jgi:hypothetical protein